MFPELFHHIIRRLHFDFSHCLDEEAEDQRDDATCARAHGQKLGRSGAESVPDLSVCKVLFLRSPWAPPPPPPLLPPLLPPSYLPSSPSSSTAPPSSRRPLKTPHFFPLSLGGERKRRGERERERVCDQHCATRWRCWSQIGLCLVRCPLPRYPLRLPSDPSLRPSVHPTICLLSISYYV